jgi:hypothetical protein
VPPSRELISNCPREGAKCDAMSNTVRLQYSADQKAEIVHHLVNKVRLFAFTRHDLSRSNLAARADASPWHLRVPIRSVARSTPNVADK